MKPEPPSRTCHCGVSMSGELMLSDCQQGLEGVYLTLQQLVLRGSQFPTQSLQ